jgi:hypothetical protein
MFSRLDLESPSFTAGRRQARPSRGRSARSRERDSLLWLYVRGPFCVARRHKRRGGLGRLSEIAFRHWADDAHPVSLRNVTEQFGRRGAVRLRIGEFLEKADHGGRTEYV